MLARWTQDNRPIVWTVGDKPETYCLYVNGDLVAGNLPFEEWYKLYNFYKDQHKNVKKEAA